jgi:hypothetical protein
MAIGDLRRVADSYERFVSHFSVYNRFDIQENGSTASKAIESQVLSGVVCHASWHDPASIF